MTKEAINSICKAIAVLCVAVGGFGSVLCLPFAMTNSFQLVSTAGIYFIAGAVMIVGGLLSYVNLSKFQ